MSAPRPKPRHAIIRKTIEPTPLGVGLTDHSRGSLEPPGSVALAEHNQLTMRSSLAWCDRKKPKLPRTGRSCSLFTMFKMREPRKRGARCQITSGAWRSARELFDGHSRRNGGARRIWWSQTGSNRRPHACKARALPTELWPQFLLSPRRRRHCAEPQDRMVGLGRLERPTSPLSGVRSNHLSYRPETQAADEPPGSRPEAPIARMSKKKEKRRRRRPAWWVLTEPNDPKRSNSSSVSANPKIDPESAEEPSLERR